MEFGSVSGEQWAIIAAFGGTIGGLLYRFIAWLRTKGAALIAWAKPKVEELADGHVSLMVTLRETQLAGTEHLKAINNRLDTHTDLLTRIDQQTCPKKTPESNA